MLDIASENSELRSEDGIVWRLEFNFEPHLKKEGLKKDMTLSVEGDSKLLLKSIRLWMISDHQEMERDSAIHQVVTRCRVSYDAWKMKWIQKGHWSRYKTYTDGMAWKGIQRHAYPISKNEETYCEEVVEKLQAWARYRWEKNRWTWGRAQRWTSERSTAWMLCTYHFSRTVGIIILISGARSAPWNQSWIH